MTKRVVAAFLWFYTGWYAGAMLAELVGISRANVYYLPRAQPESDAAGSFRGRPGRRFSLDHGCRFVVSA